MSDLIDQYIPKEHENGNGNGDNHNHNHVTNGRSSSDIFYTQRDEEIRAISDHNLPHGAVRFFLLLCKLWWFPSCGGRHGGRDGSIMASARDLAKWMGFNVKSLFKKKTKSGEVIPGWLDVLMQRNYIWISKQKLPNAEYENVYHITALCPREIQTTFKFSSRFFMPGGGVGQNGNGVFSCPELNGNSQVVELESPRYQNGHLPVGQNGNSPMAKTVTGSGPKRALGVGQNGNCQLAKTGTGSYQKGERPVGQNGNGQEAKTGHLNKTIELNKSTDPKIGGDLPPQTMRWLKKLEGMFPSRLEKLRAELVKQRERALTDQAVADLTFRIEAIDTELQGGKPTPKPALKASRPVRKATEPKPATEEEMISGAKFAMDIGKPELMTKEQKALWERRAGK